MVLENGPNWAQNLPSILMSVRGVVHKSTGYSPHELMTIRKMRLPEHLFFEVPKPMIEGWTSETFLKNLCCSLPAMCNQAAQQIGLSQRYNKMYYDQDVHNHKCELGDVVMVKNYHHEGPWTANWAGPYTVIDKCGDTVYKVCHKTKNRQPVRKRFHIDQMKPYKGSDGTLTEPLPTKS